jgi:hypothetical protein
MWLGLSLFYVGAVLCLNGLWMLGRIADREIWVINLFAFTYLWVAINRFTGADGRGLGWFSLFVAVTAVPVAIDTLLGARTAMDWWMGANWAAWAVLWAMFFVLLGLGRNIGRVTGALCIAQGVLTGWLPGYLLLSGAMA